VIRRSLSAVLFVLLAAGVAFGTAAPAPPGPGELLDHVVALTAPEMEGRGSATPGGERAAQYIAATLAAAGLRPGGDAGTYLQSFVVASDVLRAASDAGLERVSPSSHRLAAGRDWLPHGGSLAGEVRGEVVFVGHGVSESGHDDYAHVDLRGKIALAVDGVPPQLAGAQFSRLDRVIAARRAGAAALLLVSDTLPTIPATGASVGLVSASVTRKAAEALLAPSGRGLAALERGVTAAGAPRPAPTGVEARIRVAFERVERSAANVVGILPGVDPALAQEAVVVGAHYDHLGRRGGAVYPGADDNASGTAVVLGLARAFAAAGGAGRTLVFVLFSAEEIGLVGSGHYVRHPAVPVERTVAMLNFDMVGRMRDDRVNVIGVESGSGLRDIVARAAAAEALPAALRDSPFGPSDHARFYAGRVPVLFFHTGIHADYHRPSDTADKINAAGLGRVASLAARILTDVAGAPRPQYVALASPGRGEQPAVGATGEAFLGVGGDGRGESDGVPLRSVVAGSAAARAGLRDGDVLVRVGDVPVNSFDELRALLRLKRPGDSVRIVFLRAGQDQATSAILDARP
jgi:aminopeptidase YwaD